MTSPEVDGQIFIRSEKKLEIGKIYHTEITGSLDYDLFGDVI